MCEHDDLKDAIEAAEAGTITKILVTCDQPAGPELNFKPTKNLTIEGRCWTSVTGECRMTTLNLQQHSSCSVQQDTCHWSLRVENMVFDGSGVGYGPKIYWKSDYSNSLDEADFTGSVSFEKCTFRNLLNPIVAMTRFDMYFGQCVFENNVGQASQSQSMGGTNYFPGRGGAIRVIRGEVVVYGCTFDGSGL